VEDLHLDSIIFPGEEALNLVDVSMKIDQDLVNTVPATQLQPHAEHGSAPDRDQAFGSSIGQRSQARAVPRRQ
jgi:hypothetical protein